MGRWRSGSATLWLSESSSPPESRNPVTLSWRSPASVEEPRRRARDETRESEPSRAGVKQSREQRADARKFARIILKASRQPPTSVEER